MSNTEPRLPRDIELSRLIPIQAGLLQSPEELLSWSSNDEPISVMPYPGDHILSADERFLILDGHHRASRRHLMGELAISSFVICTDTEVAESNLASLKWHRTIADVLAEYEQYWRASTARKGVTNVHTLSRRQLFSR